MQWVPFPRRPRTLNLPLITPQMSYSQRDVEITARILVGRYGTGALRRAEDQSRRMERLQAHEAAATWRRLALAIRARLSASVGAAAKIAIEETVTRE